MYSRKNATELADRVRSLIGPVTHGGMSVLACDLGVNASELREILEYATPYPSVRVLAAVVAAYGVDAGWLLTGAYSPRTHRAHEEDDASPTTRVKEIMHDLELAPRAP